VAIQLALPTKTEIRGLKLRIYPSDEQINLINQTFGCCRKVYNIRVAERNAFYETVIKPETDLAKRALLWKTAKYSSVKELKVLNPYLSDPSAQSLAFAQMTADRAFNDYAASLAGKRKGRAMGHPKFWSKNEHHDSYRECTLVKDSFNPSNKTIKILKVGVIKYRLRRLPDWIHGATQVSVTITRNCGQYFASLLFKKEVVQKPKTTTYDEPVGLDMSPDKLYVTDTGETGTDNGYVQQKQKAAKKLKRLQRRLAKKKKGSKNREKARQKVAKLERDITNKRRDFIEKETLRLVQTHDLIGIEDLNVAGMKRKFRGRATSKNLQDASWSTFVGKLEWKAGSTNVVKVSRWFPSTQLCSKCGHQNRTLTLADRSWVCPVCGTEHDRDVNAAVNIKDEAIRVLVTS
jgi:putative transposase